MPEKFRLQQVLRQGSTVETHVGAACPWRVVVDGVGDQLFARTGLAADQDRRRPLGHHADLVEDAHHGRRMANEVAEAGTVAQGAALRIALLVERTALLSEVERQPDVLGDQIGDQLDEADPLIEQAVVRRIGLHRQHTQQRAAETNRDGNEWQFALIQAEPVQEARILAHLCDRTRPAGLNDAAEQTLARPVADGLEIIVIETMHGVHAQVAALGTGYGDQAATQVTTDLQCAQHFAQGLRRIERARQQLSDAREDRKLGLQQGC
ncbi:MAG: hypothetical protein AW07_02407 [Candidatus Accumulibacter sp. SK-11]|nr:MAG: hypothetical protein AW07_02407 [Candidatus Accumulibacter sp. SK-11]